MVGRLRSSFSDRRLAVLGSLLLLSAFVLAMLAARILYTGTLIHGSLAWDLVLAWIPFVLSLVVYERARQGARLRTLAGFGCVWLVFFPNAPYLLTEVKHVGRGAQVPVLYDVLLMSASAWTGLLLGLTSLFLMHAVARRFAGDVGPWGFVSAVLVLTSFGIYIGRVLRWNSWDVVAHPQWLALLVGKLALHPLEHQRPLALMVLLSAFLLVSYLAVFSFARLSPEWDALERVPADR